MLQDLLECGSPVQIVISATDLRAFGFQILSEYAANEAKKKENAAASETYLTPNQVCAMLKVNRSTLWRWKQDGYLQPTLMGGRCRYLKSSITKMMEERS